ncbi:MAG: TIGR03620 family F420-dependent LLM class oxidoreductase [Solirubrobacteraceae bacterium]
MELGRFGLWIGRALAHEHYGEAARLAEELGFGVLWLGGSPRLPKLRAMLESSTRIVIASGIVNVWAYEPAELAAEFTALDSEFPGRVLLGIGIGHPENTREYQSPLRRMRSFLDGIAAAERPVPRERMVLAALGPKMLDLSLERTLGAHPYFTPPAHTRFARERLGEAALVAPEQAVVIDPGDPVAAREVARGYGARYLKLSNYANNLRRFGVTDEAIADGGSPQLIDEMVPQGSAEQVTASVRAHLDAGADHVCVQTLQPAESSGIPAGAWRAIAHSLVG